MSRWSSRKLGVTIGALLLATGLLIAGHIDQSVWQVVFMGTVAVYIASQAGVDGVEKFKGGT